MAKIKVAATAVISFIFSWLGILAVPVLLLLGCNLIDYGTGIAAAKYRNPEDPRPVKSYTSMRGILKKVCMYLLIVVGYFVDVIINQGLASLPNVTIQLPLIVSTTIACWLIFNEMLSILENMDDIGVAIPPFLKPLLKMMKKQSENKLPTDSEDNDS